jgi:hypothetical protein
MKTSTLVTWGLIIAAVYLGSKAQECACGGCASGPQVPHCGPQNPLLDTRSTPLWIQQLGCQQPQLPFTFQGF